MAVPAPIFYGTVDAEGVFVPQDKGRLKKWLRTLAGKRAQLIIEPEKRARSNAQNAYYWGVVIKMFSDATGFTSEEAHEVLKAKFLRRHADLKGERYQITQSTSSLTVAAFEDYLEQVRQFMAVELETVVPLPGEINIQELQ